MSSTTAPGHACYGPRHELLMAGWARAGLGVAIIFSLQLPSSLLAQPYRMKVEGDPKGAPKPPPTADWGKGDHKLAAIWQERLKELTDQLDDCSDNGRFAKPSAAREVCNGSYAQAVDLSHDEGLSGFLLRGCAKWRQVSRSDQQRQDCDELGSLYWRLEDAIDRAGSADRRDRRFGELTHQYVAKVNPAEVKEQLGYLHELNSELEKSQPNPGAAFLAGKLDENLTTWLLSHCPAELAWGLPTKEYGTALASCDALEPELRRFEQNVLKLLERVSR